MKILNLYGGLGGNRLKWDDHEVTMVESDGDLCNIYQERFPNDEVWQEDVIKIVEEEDLQKFDFIWASPPCTTHSKTSFFHGRRVPDLTQLFGLRLHLESNAFHGLYCIENVQPHYKIPEEWMYTAAIDRHRFWANFYIDSSHSELDNRIPNNRMKGVKRKDQNTIIINGKIGDLAAYHDFPLELLMFFPSRKDKVLRNMLHYSIGEYVLEYAKKALYKKITNIKWIEKIDMNDLTL